MDTTALDAETIVELGEPEYGGTSYVETGRGPARRAEYTRFPVTNVVRVDRETWSDNAGTRLIVRPWRVAYLALDNETGEVSVMFRRLTADGRRDHNGRGAGVWLWTTLVSLAEQGRSGLVAGIMRAVEPHRHPDSDLCDYCGQVRAGRAHGTHHGAHPFVPAPGTLADVERRTEQQTAPDPAPIREDAATAVGDWVRSGVSFDDQRRAVATRFAGDHISREYRDALVLAIHEAEFPPPRLIRIVHRTTGDVARESDVTGWTDRQVEKLITGMSINLGHDDWMITDTADGE